MEPPETRPLRWRETTEERPGALWRAHFRSAWPHYRAWLEASDWRGPGSAAASRRRLGVEFPELLPVYDRLCELAGDDELAHRFLALYQPPPFLLGCSAVALDGPEPLLVRNYDYAPHLWEGTVWRSRWNRPVVAMSDCLWGALDGINAQGLAVALAFGGRRIVGEGFAISLLVRFLLETCATVEECRRAAPRLRSHMAYSLLVADASGDAQSIHLSPDRPPRLDSRPYLSNFQGAPEWPEHARATRAVERFEAAARLEASNPGETEVIRAFRRAPLLATDVEHSFSTLYTAVYRPRSASARWLAGDDALDRTCAEAGVAAAG